MSESGAPSGLQRTLAWLLMLVGLSVFLIRLQHAGPYAPPRGGNLLGGALALLLGLWLVRSWLGTRPLARPLTWAALAASPVVLFFALYATLAELEEVVVLKTSDRAGRPDDLRLWIVDREDGSWVAMQRSKADAHGLDGARVELLRRGEVGCVVAKLHDDRPTLAGIHALLHQKYAVQRIATAIGLFGEAADPHTVALRLDPCP